MRAAPLLAIALVVALAAHTSAQPAPFKRYRTLDTPHFHVHVPAGLEREGRVAGAAAEHAYALLAKELQPPRGAIDLVVTDDADYSNGSATPVPSNRIIVFATPPVESQALRLNDDWLGLVITHELTHIFHLDRAAGIWGLAQKVFGRGPGLFPNDYAPSWMIEGLAVYYESRFTEGGRLKDAEHRLLVRAGALEHRMLRLDELSQGTPIFPGGTGVYAYGSLFMDYLARTRGDSTIARFVDAQSSGLIPWRLNHLARRAFGTSLHDAYDAWSDSVQRSVGVAALPLLGWRELTTHGYYALDPRWLDDSTLVYAANDGRSTSAAYALSLNGQRRRLGRRNTLGPSIPLADGGLLFAQLEYTSPSELRSDLYIERDGRQRRLTEGLRLVQPDVRPDGTIVAVQLAATRASLLLLDATTREQRLLRDAVPDETWSEPRWSPDGSAIAVVHRTHGGSFALEVIDVASGAARVLDRGQYLISSPSWSADGRTLVYTSEETGLPAIVQATVSGLDRIRSERDVETNGIFTPEFSRGNRLAAVALRANGYHVGVIGEPTHEVPPRSAILPPPAPPSPIDSQPLAPGEYHRYAAWRSALPRYWYGLIENAPNGGMRLGATTSGRDVLRRHLYDASAATTTKGFFPTGSLVYRYAGFRKPYIDLDLSQDYVREGTLTNGGTTDVVGYLLRRTQNAGLAATFIRPRIRTFASFSIGGGVERRHLLTDPVEFLKQLDPACQAGCVFPSVFIAGQWSNLQRPSLSISPEDGISVAFSARERTRTDSVRERMSASAIGMASAYKSLDLPGFAHHVLALRLVGGIADRRAATAMQIGGTSGGTIQIVPSYSIGEGRRTFGVRGFPAASISGTQAAVASLEYRAPLGLGGHGFGALPFFYDRSSLSVFADAGVATCAASPLNRICSRSPQIGRTIASAGSELVLSAAIFDWDTPQRLRLGFAVPFAARDLIGARAVSVYVAYGLSF